MDNLSKFEQRLPPEPHIKFQSLTSPVTIQAYLDSLPYVAEVLDRSPLRVMIDAQAHCLDGGLFAALALWHIGFRPLILDLVPEPGKDDDHVLALFQHNGLWGAIAKSNYAGLRYREPVYRNLRELAMTYFDQFFSFEKRKTLRAYTRPLDLSRFDHVNWMWDEQGVKEISRRLYSLKPIPLIPAESVTILSPADKRTYAAATLGTNFDWVYGIRDSSNTSIEESP